MVNFGITTKLAAEYKLYETTVDVDLMKIYCKFCFSPVNNQHDSNITVKKGGSSQYNMIRTKIIEY